VKLRRALLAVVLLASLCAACGGGKTPEGEPYRLRYARQRSFGLGRVRKIEIRGPE
jgi:hypothetical protein